jgi:uncharacterized protein (DUF1330 family)
MSAYVILDIEVTDPAGYENYKKLAPPAVEKYGGRYLARGGNTATLEGDWKVSRLVILEFPDAGRARAWLASPEYAPAKTLRHKYARTKMVVVDGTG